MGNGPRLRYKILWTGVCRNGQLSQHGILRDPPWNSEHVPRLECRAIKKQIGVARSCRGRSRNLCIISLQLEFHSSCFACSAQSPVLKRNLHVLNQENKHVAIFCGPGHAHNEVLGLNAIFVAWTCI